MVSAFWGFWSLAWSAVDGSTLISSRPRLRTRSRTPYRWDWSRMSPTRTVRPGAGSNGISPEAEPRRSVNRPRTLIRYRTGATFPPPLSGQVTVSGGRVISHHPGAFSPGVTAGRPRDAADSRRAASPPDTPDLRSAPVTVPALAHRLLPARDAQLAVDVPGMGLHGVVGEEQLAGDLTQGKLAAQPAQDFLLPHAQRFGGPAAGHAGGPGAQGQHPFGPG